MTEHQVEKLFRKYKKDIIKKLGRNATTDKQLTLVGKELFGKRYIGTFSQDTVSVGAFGKTGMLIANTDTRDKNGKHWFSVYMTPKTIYIYDSYGRPSAKLLKILSKHAKDRKMNVIDSDTTDQEQKGNSEVCGQLCLAFLCVVRDLGIKKALLI